MLKCLKVSHPLCVNAILFVNVSNFLNRKNIYILTFSVGNWDP
jgi:hypothetical protein